MAHISVTWQCGHTDSIRARPRQQGYWENRAAQEICRECLYEQKNQEAAEASKAQGLPDLKGRPRQIGWAETLRHEMLAKVAELEATIPETDANRPTWDRLVRKLRVQSHASWWIDQRGLTPLDIFRRWERERQEAERAKPVAELLGQQPPPTPAVTPRVGFSHPQPPAVHPEPLREAAQDTKTPVAGYDAKNPRPIRYE